jgi:hypothetical protein
MIEPQRGFFNAEVAKDAERREESEQLSILA